MIEFSSTRCLAVSLPPTHDVISYRNKTFTFVAEEYVIDSVFLEFIIRLFLNDIGFNVFAHFSNLLQFLGNVTSSSVIFFWKE